MNEPTIIASLDIGFHKVSLLVGIPTEENTLKILGTGYAPIEGSFHEQIINIDKTAAAIRKAVELAEQQAGVEIQAVNLGISGVNICCYTQPGILTREKNGEEISQQDIDKLNQDMYRMITPAGQEILHVIPQYFSVDYQGGIIDPVGISGIKLEADYLLITVDSQLMKNLRRCIQKAGLAIDQIILEPLAAGMAVLSEEEKKEGVCLVDIGAGSTDIAIYHDGLLKHVAIIPFGGDIITRDIQEGCHVLPEYAGMLKEKFGHAMAEDRSFNEIVSIPGLRQRPAREVSVKNIAYIIEARVQEILELVHSELIISGFDEALGAGIVLTGGSAQLSGIDELCSLVCANEVRIGYPVEYLSARENQTGKTPDYAACIGLALAGFKSLDARSSLREKLIPLPYNKPQKGSNNLNRISFNQILKKTKNLLLDQEAF